MSLINQREITLILKRDKRKSISAEVNKKHFKELTKYKNPITVDILSRLVDTVNAVTFNPYEQIIFKALFLFTCPALARIEELVLGQGNNNGNVNQSDDISVLWFFMVFRT